MWDEALLNTPELQIKHHQEHLEQQQVHKTSLAPPRITGSFIKADNDNHPSDQKKVGFKCNNNLSTSKQYSV